jgi:hypothetical protein
MILVQDPILAEALAARRAIELCLLLGIRKIILEGDSLQVVHALQVSNKGPLVIGSIVGVVDIVHVVLQEAVSAPMFFHCTVIPAFN